MIPTEGRCFSELADFMFKWNLKLEPHKSGLSNVWVGLFCPDLKVFGDSPYKFGDLREENLRYVASRAKILAAQAKAGSVFGFTEEQAKREQGFFSGLADVFARYNLAIRLQGVPSQLVLSAQSTDDGFAFTRHFNSITYKTFADLAANISDSFSTTIFFNNLVSSPELPSLNLIGLYAQSLRGGIYA